MTPKLQNFEIILIYFLLLLPWPHTHVIKLFCSKDNSRLVRKIVRSKWTPILDKYQVKLPLECPLHPFRDLFAPRQDAKKRDRPTQWTCRLCGKSFYQEKLLDAHFEMRHRNVINEAEDSICLADFCDIMRCEVFQPEESMSLKGYDSHVITDVEVWSDSLRHSSALAKANAAYMSVVRTSSAGATRAAKVQRISAAHSTKEIADAGSQTTADKLKPKKIISESGPATSDEAAKHDSSSSSSSSSSGSVNDKANEANDKSTTSSPKNQTDDKGEVVKHTSNNKNNSENGNKTENDNDGANNIQKMRANCKAEDLSKLKIRCEHLVRDCIASLLLKMNNQAFRDMEEEMNKAVCWYLSCDRYWEDGPLEPRAFPWGLILILVFVLSTGICFCYYIIWILFDTEEMTINANHHLYMPPPPYQQQQLQQQQQQQLLQQQYLQTTGGIHARVDAPPQYYYQTPSGMHELYHEPPQYEYRHSPRHYIGDQRRPDTPTAATAVQRTSTPLHHHHQTNLGYQQDILDRRDYISRPIATTAVTTGSNIGPNSSATNAQNATGATNISVRDCDTNTVVMGGGSGGGGAAAGIANAGAGVVAGAVGAVGGVGVKHYNTVPRPLETQHRHTGASQTSLRGSSSTHEIIQNEIGHNEHYIYVTYPPDLKKRYYEKYE